MKTAKRTHSFTESVIRGMTRLANQHDAINLAQGFPDFPAPDVVKEAAIEAIAADVNQYAITWGSESLRNALARKYSSWYGLDVDPQSEITITCGATEAMATTVLSLVDPGDEVIVFEPFYENYGPDAELCGAVPVFVPMGATGEIDLDRLREAFSPRTVAVILNTPNNPTGRVLRSKELEAISKLCIEYDAYVFTDEIYEHIIYEGQHVPMVTLPEMRQRTITVSGASKTFSVTGWRVGSIVSPAELTGAIRKVHDFLTVGAPAPLQEGIAAALDRLDEGYYESLSRDYRRRRDLICDGLRSAGFRCEDPAGSYYVLADFSGLSDRDDTAFSEWLTREVGVAPVPGSSFFNDPSDGARLVRFAFCKSEDLLVEACRRMAAAQY